MAHGLTRRARSCLRDPSQETYFVPAYGIRRDVVMDDQFQDFLKASKKILGRYFQITPPEELGLTQIARSKFVERMRDAKAHPSEDETRQLAQTTRDGLAEIDKSLGEDFVLPLGKLARFGFNGSKNTVLGIEPLGWRGHRARYALRDEFDRPLPLGTIVTETKYAVGVVASHMAENPRFVVDGLASTTPHIKIATNRAGIRDHQFTEIQAALAEIQPRGVGLAAPIIYLRPKRDKQEELHYVRPPYPGMADIVCAD